MFKQPDPFLVEMMKKAGSANAAEAYNGQLEFASAISLPLQEALLADDVIDGIFQTIDRRGQRDLDYPVDILNPGDEKDFIAYVSPANGRIPERQVQSDYVHLRTYMIDNSIDVLLRVLRDADWDILGRMLEILKSGFQMKMNFDGWKTLLASGASKNKIVYDSTAAAGAFTRRLLSLMQIEMRRQGGTFSALRRRNLTHIYVSPETKHDVYNWQLTDIDDVSRRELYLSTNMEGALKIGGTFLVDIDQLGVGFEYNNYFINTLGQSLPGGDTEIVIGLDLSNPSFVMPIRELLSINVDPYMHRSHKAGMYGSFEGGYAALDNRDIVVGSL
jgi:hypothetical protein